MNADRVYAMSIGKVYPLLVNKATRKGRTKEEVDQIIGWLCGYSPEQIEEACEKEVSYSDFFEQAPFMNPKRSLVKGKVCGIQVETIEDPLMKEIRILDKLIDELAKGKAMTRILRDE